ncbi:MAG: hypothetical protein OXG19_01680 [Chloroflexi bacterium]|nr:hypothetical protein [Chloroflexota bacterium]
MTEDEQAAAIGKLVTEYHQQRRLVGCIRSEITTIALEMKRIGDAVIGTPPPRSSHQ